MTIQTFSIMDKIKDANEAITSDHQDGIVEVHPEVSFWAMAGRRAKTHSKRKRAGFEERRDLLVREIDAGIPDWVEAGSNLQAVKRDDVLDAIAAAWTARRVADRTACRIPASPERDDAGLRMEIVY